MACPGASRRNCRTRPLDSLFSSCNFLRPDPAVVLLRVYPKDIGDLSIQCYVASDVGGHATKDIIYAVAKKEPAGGREGLKCCICGSCSLTGMRCSCSVRSSPIV